MTTIGDALLAVRRDVGAISKGSYNDFHKFRFRGIEEVLNKVGPALERYGVNVVPETRSLDSRDITTEKGKRAREVTVMVAYHYRTPEWPAEGSEYTVIVPGESSDTGSSAVSKAMSVALRIAHLQALQIPVAMTDPEAGSFQRGDDPLRKVKQEIGAEAEKRGWVTADGDYTKLKDDFAEWSQGDQLDGNEDIELLQKYVTHLRPNRKMSRSRPAGAQ